MLFITHHNFLHKEKHPREMQDSVTVQTDNFVWRWNKRVKPS